MIISLHLWSVLSTTLNLPSASQTLVVVVRRQKQNKLVMLSVIIERLAIVKHGSDAGCEEVIMLILAEDVDRVTFMSEKSAASN